MNWEILAWACTAAAVLGAFLNAAKRIEGFYVWAPTNALWILYFTAHEQWASATLFAVYFVICIQGILIWRALDVMNDFTEDGKTKHEISNSPDPEG